LSAHNVLKVMELTSGAAIVTGAAGGIGSVIAGRLVSGGMAVVLADIDRDGLERVRGELMEHTPGAELAVVRGDVGDAQHHEDLVVAAEDLGGLRLSVLNAGVSLGGLSWEVPLERWELTTRVNYWGVVHGLRAALAVMVPRQDGWVVAVSSGAGLVATPGLAPYVATKHAVVGMMESARHELARIDSPVGASVVCPGNIATDMPDRPVPAGSVGATDADAGSAFPEVVQALAATTRAGVRAGEEPATVANALVDGVTEGRFWILPQPELAWAATDRTRRIAEGDDPVDLLG
jgi:NAD(P)-dependent dehydrogenase (short-subunit alcohol dehydrogenase family)